MSGYHRSVLLQEAVDGLKIQPGHWYVDGTAGGGGHTEEILNRGGRVIAIDTDRDSIREVTQRLKGTFPKTEWKVVQGNFRDIETVVRKETHEEIDGVLLDLGVSSHQLDTRSRGFSYRFTESPLDLRLNQEQEGDGAYFVATASEQQLFDCISTYGEELRARDIARAIVKHRRTQAIRTTGELISVLEEAVGKNQMPVYSRVFQAIRIAINDELESITLGLQGAQRLLVSNGRLVVISFHSLEDRIVKQTMRSKSWRMITKKPIVPGREEQHGNSRSRSAKMRIAEKI